MIDWPTAAVDWKPGFRIIPTRFPSISLFDRVADAPDFDALYALEAMTNDRIRDQVGAIQLVPPSERLYGPGSGPIMAAFTHLNPSGSRFSDGTYGVFYAAREKMTAVAETRHHSSAFMRATAEQPMWLQMRLYRVDVAGDVADLMDARKIAPELLDPDSYAASQALGRRLREAGELGIRYPSVRAPDGECVAAFRTSLLRNCLHEAHLEYHWNGKEIDYVTQQLSQ